MITCFLDRRTVMVALSRGHVLPPWVDFAAMYTTSLLLDTEELWWWLSLSFQAVIYVWLMESRIIICCLHILILFGNMPELPIP